MTKEVAFCVWKPIKYNGDLYVKKILDSDNGLEIYLVDHNNRSLRVLFEDALSYRNTNESFLIDHINSHKELSSQEVFFISSKSNYLDWIHENSYQMYLDQELMHYMIYTMEDCIDIISREMPLVTWT